MKTELMSAVSEFMSVKGYHWSMEDNRYVLSDRSCLTNWKTALNMFEAEKNPVYYIKKCNTYRTPAVSYEGIYTSVGDADYAGMQFVNGNFDGASYSIHVICD